jgi:hypothetical protein
MNAVRFYPRWQSILVHPACVAIVVGVPFTRPPVTYALSVAVFLAAFIWWRHFLRGEIRGTEICGRDPQTLRWTCIETAAVTRAEAGHLGLGRVKGWILLSTNNKAVFVNEGASTDPFLGPILRRIPEG